MFLPYDEDGRVLFGLVAVWFVESLATLLVTAFLALTAYTAYVHHRYAHIPGPPYSSFYLGHLPCLKRHFQSGEFGHLLFIQWVEEYGYVIKFFTGPRCVILVTGVPFIKELLTKSRYLKSPATYKALHSLCGTRFLGTGLLTEIDYQKWHRRRVVMNPAFHKKYLRLFMEQFNSVGDKWITKLNSLADGKTVFSMHDHLCRVTLDAISEVGFSYHMNAVETNDNLYLTHILNVVKGIAKCIRDPFFKFRLSERGFRNEVYQSVHFLRSLGARLMKERRALLARGEPVPDDILTRIIKLGEGMQEITDEDIIDDFLTFFVAGQETTANALSFVFCEVGRRPEILEKIQKEIDEVLQGRSHMAYDDLSKLEYVGQVFKESLRLYPPAAGTARFNVDEVTIDGLRLPAKSQLMISFFATHRLSAYHKDPLEFLPERFSPDAERKLFTFMPFSVGHRSCIGQQFALIESKVLLSKFFQKFDFKLDPNQSFAIANEVATLRPKGGTMMSISGRS